MKKFFIISLVFAYLYHGMLFAKNLDKKPIKQQVIPTILISIDGFAEHYLKTYQPKNILKLAETGVKAKAMIPVFPSKTFPNHISIATGNYPAVHGVIHNSFYNRDFAQLYKLGNGKKDPKWLNSPTLWSIAEDNGIKTGIYFWPESEVNTLKNKPSYVKPYKHSTPNKKRFNQIIDWLNLPEEERPSLLMAYFSTVDSAGHDFGTDTNNVQQAISTIDRLLGEFLNDLKTKVNYEVNIVLVSDHGMTNISADTIKYDYLFKDLEGFDDIRVVDGQTQLYVYLPEADIEREESLVKLVKSRMSDVDKARVNVYNFSHYPKDWHFNERSSVMPNVVLESLPPYVFGKSARALAPYAAKKERRKKGATHGFHPKHTSELNAIFIANGPSFKEGLVINSFQNIYVFPLLLTVLGIDIPEDVNANTNILLPILNQ